MNITHILEELAHDTGELPREALEGAISQQPFITPYLLNILEDAVNRVEEIIEYDHYQGHLYAMYLLAQFRERAAYPLIIQLLSFPGEIPHAIAGDVLTEDLPRILASVSGGEIQPLKEIIENPLISEYVRAAAQTTLVVLVGCNMQSRDSIIAYFRLLFREKLIKKPSFIWGSLISCCCALYPKELYKEITKAFEENLVDSCFITLQEVDNILQQNEKLYLKNFFHNTELIDDTVVEMEKWISSST